MRGQILQQPLCRLCQPEACPQINCQGSHENTGSESWTDFSGAGSSFQKDPDEHNQKDSEREDLESETGEQDVVVCFLVAISIGVGCANQSGASHLKKGSHDIAAYEAPQDEFRRQRSVFSTVEIGQCGSDCVDGCAEENRSDDNTEVLDSVCQ